MRLFRRRADEAEAPSQSPQWQRNPLVGPDPVIDPDTLVANPELDEAIARWLANNEDVEARKAMKLALARAVYLAPVRFGGPADAHPGERRVFDNAATFGFLRCAMPAIEDATAVGVCTNEGAYRRCAPEGSAAQLMRAADLFVLAIESPDSAGLLINPGDGQNALPLYRPWCEEIRYLLGRGPHPFPALNESGT